MRFYIVQDSLGAALGCELTLKAAHQLGRDDTRLGHTPSYSIVRVDCAVDVETVRRLLGNLGGYAIESSTRTYNRGRS